MDKAKGKSAPKWELIESEYITTRASYRALIEKYNVPKTTLMERARREEWVSKRQAYRQSVVAQTVQRMSTRASEDAIKKLEKLQAVSDKLSHLIDKTLDDADQFYRYVFVLGDESGQRVVDSVEAKLDAKALRDFTAAVKDLVSVTRNVYSLPTDAEKEAQRVARAKLKLDQDKAAREAKEENPGEIHIVIDGPEGWAE